MDMTVVNSNDKPEVPQWPCCLLLDRKPTIYNNMNSWQWLSNFFCINYCTPSLLKHRVNWVMKSLTKSAFCPTERQKVQSTIERLINPSIWLQLFMSNLKTKVDFVDTDRYWQNSIWWWNSNLFLNTCLPSLSAHSLHTSQWKQGSMSSCGQRNGDEQVSEQYLRLLWRSCTVKESFCWSSRGRTKTSPERSRDYTTAFTAQQCSPWLQGKGFQLFTGAFHNALTYFLLDPLSARVNATLHGKSDIRVQVQSYNNVFWNVLGRATELFWRHRHLTVL